VSTGGGGGNGVGTGGGGGNGVDTVADLLARARAHLTRLDPRDALAAVDAGALLVDIRPGWQRLDEGTVPGAVVIERNHLEWRLDPTSDARIAEADSHDRQWIVLCSEGYTSSLAAAALQELGLLRATDVVGGFRAWSEAGLPTAPGSGERPDYARHSGP
jgi:rhodanese-related sulfurtransferase